MKKVLITLIFIITACLSTNVYAANSTVYQDYNSTTCTKTGDWSSSHQVGYVRQNSIMTNSGKITWIEKSNIAPARVSVWVTVDEDGCDDAVVTLITEHYKGDYNLSFCEGKSGWREIAIVSVTGPGLTVELKSGTNGKTYANAIKVEYLDTQYIKLSKFIQTFPDHIFFTNYATTGYRNNERIKTDSMPLVEENDAYVTAKAVFKYFDEVVSIDDNKAEITIDGINIYGLMDDTKYYVNGKENKGTFLKIYNNTPVINITAIARAMGKNVFVSKRGIALISDNTINLNEKLDMKLILDTIMCLRYE